VTFLPHRGIFATVLQIGTSAREKMKNRDNATKRACLIKIERL
jgi:hypothetical protein